MDTTARTAILLLGMHRSGTSALMGALAQCGVALPHNLMPANFANERGYFESLAFMALHEEMLAAAGTAWNDWRAFPASLSDAQRADFKRRARDLLAEEFGDATLFALKDPRICRFAPFWLEVLAEAGIEVRVVTIVRPAQEVALSLVARDGMIVEEGVLLWLRHALDAERETRALPRTFIEMDELLDDWRAALARIGREIGVKWPALDADADGAISAFLTRSLKHQNVHPDGEATDWAHRALGAMRLLCRDPGSRQAQAALDDVSAEFETSCQLFGPVVDQLLRQSPNGQAPVSQIDDDDPQGVATVASASPR